jgi:hypothetical protein
MRKQAVIGAAEAGEYVFCRRAWWLRRVQGATPVNETELRAGARLHSRHGGHVRMAAWLHYGGYTLALLAILLAGLWLLPYFL